LKETRSDHDTLTDLVYDRRRGGKTADGADEDVARFDYSRFVGDY